MDFFNDLQDFFATMSGQEMLFFWVVAGLLFIIGLLIGLLIRGRGLNYYKKQYLLAEKERVDLAARSATAEQRRKALEKEVATLSQEKVAAIERCQELEKRPSADDDEVAALRDQIQLLQSENDDLRRGSTELPSPDPTTPDVQDYLNAAEARFQAFEQRLAEIGEENVRLQTKLNSVQNEGGTASADRGISQPYGKPHEPIIGKVAAVQEVDDEPLVIRADVTNPGVRTDDDGGMEIIVDTVPSVIVPVMPPHGLSPDDLQQIQNIGPFIEKKLNEIGTFTYGQIAGWSAVDIKRVTAEIGYVPGIIERDDWVGQAQQLRSATKGKSSEKADEEVKTSPVDSSLIDQANLQVIEGIGPKIEGILKAAKIKTLSDLADSTPEALRTILAEAGSHFKSHNPDTWPQQATLASQGELEALKAMQDSM